MNDEMKMMANMIQTSADATAANLIFSKELGKINAKLDEMNNRLSHIAEWRPSEPRDGAE